MLIAYMAMRIVLGLMNPPSLWEPAPIIDQRPAAKIQQNTAYDFSSDPFSLSVEAAPRLNDLGETAPETTLQLTLTGLISGLDGEVNLRTPDGREARYTSGDEIMRGVALEAINPKFIVLNVNGEIQRLTFDDDSQPFIASAKPTAQNAALGAVQGQSNLSIFEQLFW